MMLSKKRTILKTMSKHYEYTSRQPLPEIVQALEELSPDAFRLLAYMYTKSDDWVFNNADMQKRLGLAESTIKKKIKELKDKKYYHECKGVFTVYLIGLNAVADFLGEEAE